MFCLFYDFGGTLLETVPQQSVAKNLCHQGHDQQARNRRRARERQRRRTGAGDFVSTVGIRRQADIPRGGGGHRQVLKKVQIRVHPTVSSEGQIAREDMQPFFVVFFSPLLPDKSKETLTRTTRGPPSLSSLQSRRGVFGSQGGPSGPRVAPATSMQSTCPR